MQKSMLDVLTITLNPAIDETLSIPGFTAGAVNRVESRSRVAGGKGVNVASVLADAGFTVAATGFLGQDNEAIFRTLCQTKRIVDRFIRLPGETRTGIKVVNPATQATTDINFPGLALQPDNLAQLGTVIQATPARWTVLAGSVPPGLDAGCYGPLVEQVRCAGGKVALDTSGQALELALPMRPHLIKPNVHELEEMLGRSLTATADVAAAAMELVGQGIEMVAVSMGAEGAVVATAGEVLLAIPPRVPVRSTVGAGDAMVSGLVAGQLLGLSLEEGARLATAYSLCALQRLEAGLPSADQVQALQARVRVERLEWVSGVLAG